MTSESYYKNHAWCYPQYFGNIYAFINRFNISPEVFFWVWGFLLSESQKGVKLCSDYDRYMVTSIVWSFPSKILDKLEKSVKFWWVVILNAFNSRYVNIKLEPNKKLMNIKLTRFFEVSRTYLILEFISFQNLSYSQNLFYSRIWDGKMCWKCKEVWLN